MYEEIPHGVKNPENPQLLGRNPEIRKIRQSGTPAGARFLELGAWRQVSGARCEVHGARCQAPHLGLAAGEHVSGQVHIECLSIGGESIVPGQGG